MSKHRSDNPGKEPQIIFHSRVITGTSKVWPYGEENRNAKKIPVKKTREHRDHLETETKLGQQRTYLLYTTSLPVLPILPFHNVVVMLY